METRFRKDDHDRPQEHTRDVEEPAAQSMNERNRAGQAAAAMETSIAVLPFARDGEPDDEFDTGGFAIEVRTGLAAPCSGRRGTSSLEAYDLFREGRALLFRRGRPIFEALSCLEQAIALDPSYTEALELMAESYRLIGIYSMAPFRQVMPRAREAAERALALDPGSVEALATRANVEAQYDRDYARGLKSWELALALDPHHTRARCERALWGLGCGALGTEQAVDEARRAVGDDPLNAWALGMQSLVFGLTGHRYASISAAQRAVEIDPGAFFAQWNLLRSLTWGGHHAQALRLGRRLIAAWGRHPWTLAVLGYAYAGLGEAAIARAIYHELVARSRIETIAPGWAAAAAAAAGRIDEAMELARRAVTERDSFAVLARRIPLWAALRDHPDFGALLAELGLACEA